MVKFSIKYYLKCIALSFAFYLCGGFVLSFFITEEDSFLSIAVPIIMTSISIFIRIIILKNQINKSHISYFEITDYFKMSLPAIFLLALTAVLLICDTFISNINNLMYKSLFDNVKSIIFVLFPGGLTVDGIIYNLSYWNDVVYYSLLVINTVIYILPTLMYMHKKNNAGKRRDGSLS